MVEQKKGAAFFPVMFGLISLLFIVILLVVYRISRQVNPVMLDEQGRPASAGHH